MDPAQRFRDAFDLVTQKLAHSGEESRVILAEFTTATHEFVTAMENSFNGLMSCIDLQRTTGRLIQDLLVEVTKPDRSSETFVRLKIKSEATIDQLRMAVEFLPEDVKNHLNHQLDNYLAMLSTITSSLDEGD